MTRPRTLLMALAALGVLALFVHEPSAQIPVADNGNIGKFRRAVCRFTGDVVPGDGVVDVYEAPSNKSRQFNLSDVIIANTSMAATVRAVLLVEGDAITGQIVVPPNSTFSHTFGTGFPLDPDEVLQVQVLAGQAQFTVTGPLLDD